MKSISLTLICLVLLQGCVVYQKTPVSINNAVSKGPVKVVDTEYDVWHFANIVYMDSTYYGIIKGKTYQKKALDSTSIMSIQVIDTDSTKRANTIAISAASITLVIATLLTLILIGF